MTNRRGFTLIEVLVAIAVTAVLLGVAVGLLHAVFYGQQAAHERLRERMTMDRLARQFREDVHAAAGLADAEVAALDQRKLPGWRLQPAGGPTIEYWVAGGALVRAEREGGKTTAHDEFALPAGAKVEIRLDAAGKPALARLRIAPGDEASAGVAPPVLVVEGVLGWDRRFVAAPGGTPKAEEKK